MRYQVKGTAHVAFVMTIDSASEERAEETVEKILIDAFEFGKPDRCSVDVDVSIRSTEPSPSSD
jgi:hypothetical protein